MKPIASKTSILRSGAYPLAAPDWRSAHGSFWHSFTVGRTALLRQLSGVKRM